MSKATSLAEGLKHLDDIRESQVESLVQKVRVAEDAMNKASREMDEAIVEIADTIAKEWSYMDIWMTPLRGEAALIRRVREVTGES